MNHLNSETNEYAAKDSGSQTAHIDGASMPLARRLESAARSLLHDLVWIIKDPQGWKGEAFERRVVKKLRKLYPAASTFHHVYVPKADGTTSELDVVMVTRKAIYVFECKNYAGWIFGKEADSHWTQVLNRSTKNRFYNPIKQNRTHVEKLQAHLSSSVPNSSVPIESIVIFSEKAELKKVS